MIIREVEKPTIRDLSGIVTRPVENGDITAGHVLNKIQFTGSGKGALALVLRYLSEKKIIPDKLSEVIVADWIGYWVYNQIQPFAFPSKRFSERSKAILVYHQYGFPQNMDKILEFATDKNLVVIEDCAHAVASYYKGKMIGTFGDFSIYSFSKWIFCFALGGVRSNINDFNSFADEIITDTPLGVTFLKDFAKTISELSLFSRSAIFKRYANLFLNMSYALYGDAFKPSRQAVRLLNSKIGHEIAARQERYAYFRKRTDHLGICDHLEEKGITPYVIPVRCPEGKNEGLLTCLREMGVITGLYHFDMNRNLLCPDFVKCVWLPCHGRISDEMFDAITETVLRAL